MFTHPAFRLGPHPMFSFKESALAYLRAARVPLRWAIDMETSARNSLRALRIPSGIDALMRFFRTVSVISDPTPTQYPSGPLRSCHSAEFSVREGGPPMI